jgi:Domain of unknown function (DUF4440)
VPIQSFAAIALAIFTCAIVRADGQTAAREQEIKAVEQRWLDHEDRPEVVEFILADDFVHVLPVGFIGKRDHLEYLRKHPDHLRGIRCFEELRVRLYAEVAVATGIVYAVRSDGTPKRTNFTDVFVRRNGAWLAVNAQESPVDPQIHSNSAAAPGNCLK